jgi:hypothetical protein
MDDLKITTDNHKLLALTERREWGAFVNMVDNDMQALDRISSLVIEGKTKEQIADEVLLRYQTRESVINYINQTIERAERALFETKEETSDIIKHHT